MLTKSSQHFPKKMITLVLKCFANGKSINLYFLLLPFSLFLMLFKNNFAKLLNNHLHEMTKYNINDMTV